MTESPDAIAVLYLWQFSLSYDDLPVREDADGYVEGQIYRSEHFPRHVFVYHRSKDDFDCFVWRP
jgi:hypothetical protein